MKKKTVSTKRRKAAPGRRIALTGTVRRSSKSAEVKHLSWEAVEVETLTPLFHRQLIVGQEIMLARIRLKKGCLVPWHSHANEQVSSIFEGALKFWIAEKEIVVGPGEVLAIPPNMPHKAEALEDTVAVDVFNPPRADWINKTDSYLRK